MLDIRRTLLPDRILTREEAAEFIGRGPSTIDRYVARGALKCHRIGASPAFILSEILAAVAAGALESAAPKPGPPCRPHRFPKAKARTDETDH